MKDPILSNNERAFVEKAIAEGLRIDKRGLNEFRNLGIFFGKNYGSTIVCLGDTKVFASCTCEVSIPKTTRPNEGTIFINVEMGNQQNEQCIVVTRILERTIRESRCIDLESLCIVAEEKVWNLRIDITVLNNEGNVIGKSLISKIISIKLIKVAKFHRLCLYSSCISTSSLPKT
jgi:exosome complex component RRP45